MKLKTQFLGWFLLNGCVFDPTGVELPDKESATDNNKPTTSFSTTGKDGTTSDNITIDLVTDSNITSISTGYESTSSTSTSTSTGLIIESSTTIIDESTSTTSDTTLDSTTEIDDVTTGEDIPNKCGDRFLDLEEDCDWAAYENTQASICVSPETATEKDLPCTLKILQRPLLHKDMQLAGTFDNELNLEEGHIVCKLMFKNPDALAKDYAVYNGVTPGYGVISNINWQGAILLKSHSEGYKGQPMYYYDPSKVPFNPQLGQSLYVPAGCNVP